MRHERSRGMKTREAELRRSAQLHNMQDVVYNTAVHSGTLTTNSAGLQTVEKYSIGPVLFDIMSENVTRKNKHETRLKSQSSHKSLIKDQNTLNELTESSRLN